MDQTICEITKHAYSAAKKRFNWKKNVLGKMANLAFNRGIKHSDTAGNLNKYITSLWFKYKTANNIRVYGDNVYFFKDTKLITLYRLPNDLLKYIQKIKERNSTV